MNGWKDKLAEAWNDNPLAFIGTGAVVASAAAAVINAMSAAKGRRAYAKQVNYRVKHKK